LRVLDRIFSHIYSSQYVTKYSAAFWGTSFVREMTKIPYVEDLGNDLSEGQASLKIKKEDLKGSDVVNGSVPVTPAVNATA
jgi:trehalose 6-phosphate synthase